MKTAATNDRDQGEWLVLTVVASSWLIQRVGSVNSVVQAAIDSSRFVASMRRGRRQWDAAGWRTRRRVASIGLLTAAATVVALTAGAGAMEGWMWLVPPGTAAAVGVLLFAASRGEPSVTKILGRRD